MDEEKHFVIQDLDETHLLVSADSVDMIKEQLEEEVREATSACRTVARLLARLPFCSWRRIPLQSRSSRTCQKSQAPAKSFRAHVVVLLLVSGYIHVELLKTATEHLPAFLV